MKKNADKYLGFIGFLGFTGFRYFMTGNAADLCGFAFCLLCLFLDCETTCVYPR